LSWALLLLRPILCPPRGVGLFGTCPFSWRTLASLATPPTYFGEVFFDFTHACLVGVLWFSLEANKALWYDAHEMRFSM
jgi:hypothetical protein